MHSEETHWGTGSSQKRKTDTVPQTSDDSGLGASANKELLHNKGIKEKRWRYMTERQLFISRKQSGV